MREKKKLNTLLKFINQNERFIIKIYFGLMEIALCVISSVLFILFLLQSRLCILGCASSRFANSVCATSIRDISRSRPSVNVTPCQFTADVPRRIRRLHL